MLVASQQPHGRGCPSLTDMLRSSKDGNWSEQSWNSIGDLELPRLRQQENDCKWRTGVSWPSVSAGPLGSLQMLYRLCAEYLAVFLAPEDPRLEMDPRHKKFLLGRAKKGTCGMEDSWER